MTKQDLMTELKIFKIHLVLLMIHAVISIGCIILILSLCPKVLQLPLLCLVSFPYFLVKDD